MFGIAFTLILILSALFTWLIVISAASLGFILQPWIVFIVVFLIIILLSK